MTTPSDIKQIISDPDFLKLSGTDQVAILEHLESRMDRTPRISQGSGSPWNRPIMPEIKPTQPQGPGGFLPFLNRGIAESVGAIPDLIRSGVNALPGTPEENRLPPPFLGRQSIERGMGTIGIQTPAEGQQPKTIPEYMGNVTGQATSLLIPGAATAKKLSGATTTTQRVASSIWESIVKHPYLTMVTEMTGGMGAGGARGVVEKISPDAPPWVKTTAEIGGGLAGAIAPLTLVNTPTMAAIRGGKFLYKKLRSPFSGAGQKYRAGEWLRGEMADPEAAIARLDEPTITNIPPAIRTQEQKIAQLYKSLSTEDPVKNAEAVEQLTDSIIKLDSEMRSMGYGSPELLEDVIRQRRIALETRMDKRIVNATQKAQERLDKLPVAQRKASESRIVNEELRGVMKSEKAKVDAAWQKVDKAIVVPTDNSKRVYKELVDDLGQAQRVDIPDAAKYSKILKSAEPDYVMNPAIKVGKRVIVGDYAKGGHTHIINQIDKNPKLKELFDKGLYTEGTQTSSGKFVERRQGVDFADIKGRNIYEIPESVILEDTEKAAVTSLREMQSLRSKLLETARQARKDGEWNKARIADEVADAILLDLDNAAGNIAPLRDAIAMTRHFKTRFESGEVAKILGWSKSGAPAINPDLTLEVSVGRLGERGAIDMDKIVVTPEARAATERYLGRSFTDYAAEGGTVSPVKAERWVRNNEKILDEYPDLRTKMMDSIESQKLADQTRIRMDARKKRLQDPKISMTARFLKTDRLDDKISDVLKTRNPTKTTAELVKQARKDPDGLAIEGLKSGFIDHILKNSAYGEFNDIGERSISGRAMLAFLRKNYSTLGQVFNRDELVKMEQVAREFVKLERLQKLYPGKVKIELKDWGSNISQVAARLAGAEFGGRTGGSMGGSLVHAQIFSGRAKKLVTWLTKDRTEQLIKDAVLSNDPELLKTLLSTLKSPSVTKPQLLKLNKVLNLWLAGTGERVWRDIEQEGQ